MRNWRLMVKEERLAMHERLALANRIAKEYQKASKKQKSVMLKEFCDKTDYNIKYASHLLSHWHKVKLKRIDGKLVRIKAGSKKRKKYAKRQRIYDDEFQIALIELWEFSDFLCSIRLKVFLTWIKPFICTHKRFTYTQTIWKKMEKVSASTIERIIKVQRDKYKIKGNSHTKKSNSPLKQSIPIRTFSEWKDEKIGSLAIDLVGHDGGNASGEFCFTLNATDVPTTWTEPMAIKNKARKWTVEALDVIINRMPIKVHSVHSDNGSEFINDHFLSYCKGRLNFTRSRSHNKNDNCYVEQKNDAVVRRSVGYSRYDTGEELALLNELYASLRLWVNYFTPSRKLIEKTRYGSKVIKKYDEPKTPYQRVLESKDIDENTKRLMDNQFSQCDPVKIRKNIVRIQKALYNINMKKNSN